MSLGSLVFGCYEGAAKMGSCNGCHALKPLCGYKWRCIVDAHGDFIAQYCKPCVIGMGKRKTPIYEVLEYDEWFGIVAFASKQIHNKIMNNEYRQLIRWRLTKL